MLAGNKGRKDEIEAKVAYWSAWVAQLVECLPSAQVMIPGVLGSSPASGSLLIRESASPSAFPLLVLSLSQIKKTWFLISAHVF